MLVDLDHERCLRAFTEKAGLTTMKDYIDNCHQRGFFGKYEMGLIDDVLNRFERVFQNCGKIGD